MAGLSLNLGTLIWSIQTLKLPKPMTNAYKCLNDKFEHGKFEHGVIIPFLQWSSTSLLFLVVLKS